MTTGQSMADKLAESVDISPEAVERMVDRMEAEMVEYRLCDDLKPMLRALRSALTAAQRDLAAEERGQENLRRALTASGELVHELRDALKSLSDMYAFPGESNTERFERVAERFYAETGVIAPGKDVSAGGWNGMTYEDRVKRFEDWYAEKAANARAAMEKANG